MGKGQRMFRIPKLVTGIAINPADHGGAPGTRRLCQIHLGRPPGQSFADVDPVMPALRNFPGTAAT